MPFLSVAIDDQLIRILYLGLAHARRAKCGSSMYLI